MERATNVEQVRDWYQARSPQLLQSGLQISLHSNDDADVMKGKVEIRVETRSSLASITFWNHGSVMAFAINKQSKAEQMFDDRSLTPGENLAALLEGYFEEIVNRPT